MAANNHIDLGPGTSISHPPGGKLSVLTRGPYLGEFALMFQAAMAKASKEAYEAMPTLGILLANVERQNLVRIKSSRIAQALDVSQATVERHLRKLRQLQLIVPDSAEGSEARAVFNWRICPYLAWRGGTDKLNEYLKSLPKDHIWHTYNIKDTQL
jgi:DNA-binding transcriptional ArsR family regulator